MNYILTNSQQLVRRHVSVCELVCCMMRGGVLSKFLFFEFSGFNGSNVIKPFFIAF